MYQNVANTTTAKMAIFLLGEIEMKKINKSEATLLQLLCDEITNEATILC